MVFFFEKVERIFGNLFEKLWLWICIHLNHIIYVVSLTSLCRTSLSLFMILSWSLLLVETIKFPLEICVVSWASTLQWTQVPVATPFRSNLQYVIVAQIDMSHTFTGIYIFIYMYMYMYTVYENYINHEIQTWRLIVAKPLPVYRVQVGNRFFLYQILLNSLHYLLWSVLLVGLNVHLGLE